MDAGEFGFGIEAEFLLVDKNTYEPFSHRNLDFDSLLALINSIPCDDFSKDGLNIKPLHTKAIPYLIEGYCLTDSNMKTISLMPKGIEARTPMASTIDKSVRDLKILFDRLREHCLKSNYDLSILSHHPNEPKFNAPPNYKRHDYWQWALTATTTFGPDINISVPDELSKSINRSKLNGRINHYMPSAIAMSLASPISEGKLWQFRGQSGKSIRTFRRSIWAPIFYVHEKPALRFEFKGFEMATCLEDYNVYFLLSLALLLDDSLSEEAGDETKLYDLGSISLNGLDSIHTREIAKRVMESAEKMASQFGFKRDGMDEFWNRIESRHLPADDIIDLFNEKQSVPYVLSKRSNLYYSDVESVQELSQRSSTFDLEAGDHRSAALPGSSTETLPTISSKHDSPNEQASESSKGQVRESSTAAPSAERELNLQLPGGSK